jgi:acid-sensing ion channel, other
MTNTGYRFTIKINFERYFRVYNASNPFQPYDNIRLIVHDTDELPSYSGYQLIHSMWPHTKVEIFPEIHLIDDTFKMMPLERRQCYLRNEKILKYFKVYTKKNCDQECLSDMMQRKCGCVPFYIISK